MRDMYNDSTGSRKKFLIPLVVLLLCAVSLTGAGYAYNTSVTSQDNVAPVDEYFVIDLYNPQGAVVADKVTAAAVNGIVFTTDKVVTDGDVTLAGEFALELIDPVVIQCKNSSDTEMAYTGMFAVTADQLARGGSPTTTTTASVAVSQVSENDTPVPYVKFVEKENALYHLENGASVTAEFRYFTNPECTTPADINAIPISAPNTPQYTYFQIVITAVTGQVIDAQHNTSAKVFAEAVIAALQLEYNFKFTATANEVTAITLNANGGDGNGAVNATVGEALPAFTALTKDGDTLQGYFTTADGDVKVINADGTLVANIDGFTDAQAKWISKDPTLTLYAQWA